MDQVKKVGVGFGVIIINDGKILLGLRNSDPAKADSELHGEGTWTMPGGKFEYGETFEEAGKREVKEETDLDLLSAEVFCVQNDMNEYAHFVTVGMIATKVEGDVKTMEPEEITEWQWFDLEDLPANIYPPSAKCIEKYREGVFYKP